VVASAAVIEFTLTHRFACSVDRFWQLFWDADWTKTLIIEGLGFATCDIEPTVEAGGKKKRSMRVTPKLDIPAAVAKILGPKLGYTENGQYDLATGLWSYDLVLSVLSERIRMGGQLTVEADGPDRCVRHSKLRCEVSMFGVGGLIEKAAEKNMRDGWEKASAWTVKWLAEHP
jgi:hypothetical protein